MVTAAFRSVPRLPCRDLRRRVSLVQFTLPVYSARMFARVTSFAASAVALAI
jgi:hypothetical protein